MRILFDYNNLACRCVHLQQIHNNDDRSWSLMAYMMFTTMYNFLSDISEWLDIGEKLDVTLALDSKTGYWRREIYAPYKADRQKKRRDDGIDWDRAYIEFEKLATAIQQSIPWHVMRVDKCEADDVIYTLAKNNSEEPVVIHSGDSDYLQLISDNVSLFLPHVSEYAEFPRMCKISGGEVLCENPAEYLQYAILTGQGGKDNVYNVKTPTDWDCNKRKPGFGVKAAQKVLAAKDLQAELTRLGLWDNYMRNKQLIDMAELPTEYKNRILTQYTATALPDLSLRNLLGIYDWPSLLACAAEKEAYLRMWHEGKKEISRDTDIDTNLVTMEFAL